MLRAKKVFGALRGQDDEDDEDAHNSDYADDCLYAAIPNVRAREDLLLFISEYSSLPLFFVARIAPLSESFGFFFLIGAPRGRWMDFEI